MYSLYFCGMKDKIIAYLVEEIGRLTKEGNSARVNEVSALLSEFCKYEAEQKIVYVPYYSAPYKPLFPSPFSPSWTLFSGSSTAGPPIYCNATNGQSVPSIQS